jgi:hypothetical protein
MLVSKRKSMKKIYWLVILIGVCFGSLQSQKRLVPSKQKDKKEAFSYLKTLDVSEGVVVKYNPKGTEVINKEAGDLPEGHFLYEEEGPGVLDRVVMQVRLNQNSSINYYLVFSWGPSGDPCYRLYNANNKKYIGSVHGTNIYIPGNGKLYSHGKENACFELKQKYELRDDKLYAVRQPFYDVGLKTKTQKAIKIYSDKEQTEVLASLPVNYDVEVLLADGDAINELFLLKTSFGLVGWVKVKTYGKPDVVDIKGLQFYGD